MKVWVRKQREVVVEVAEKDNEDAGIKAGDLAVTEDSRTRFYSPREFEERFEQIEKNSWPGFLKRKSGNSFMLGTHVVTFEGATLEVLAQHMNAWAEKAENRHLILGDEGDKVFQGTDGRFYALYYCYAQTLEEVHAHLAEREAIETEVKAEVERRWEEKKKQLGIDERNALEKAKAAQAAQEAIDRAARRELERLADIGRACQNNHGKTKGKKA